jgi:hypothetical protein
MTKLKAPKFFDCLAKTARYHAKNLKSTDEHSSSDWVLFRQSLTACTNYLEYGSGASTSFVARNYQCNIRTIETAVEWAETVRESLNNRAEVTHIDLGPTGPLGRPIGYSQRARFVDYFESGFANGFSPDVILVDGRFRVAVFLTALLRALPGSKIIFDDYSRDRYKIVEEIISPSELSPRQALFVVPQSIDSKKILQLRAEFAMVMD